MATLANAALQLTISGPSCFATGAVQTYTVGYTMTGLANNNLVAADVDIVCTIGTIGGGVILATNRDKDLDFVGIDSLTGNYEVGILNDIHDTDLGSPLFSFQYTAPMACGVQTISLIENCFYDTDWNQITGSDLILPSIRVSPEPMTLGLLGIGGLFLRCRKR
jgi:hypothetical protein